MKTLALLILGLFIRELIALSPTSKHQQLFLDSASISSWEKFIPLGIFHGITTNPVLLKQAGVPCDIKSLKSLAHTALYQYDMNCFMVQTWGIWIDELIRNGSQLQGFSERVVVKVPLTANGIEAAVKLIEMNVRVCMTACYTPHQVLTSAALGAEYVAPYLGRMCDAGKDGINDIIQMQRIVESFNSDTRVLVASLRETNQLATLSAAGLNTFTFSPQIADGLINDPLTQAAAEDFEKAASSF